MTIPEFVPVDLDDERIRELRDEYYTLAHAMQSGVKWDQENGSDDGSPKHLRVGVNNALTDHSSLVKLLIKKGLITDLEYAQAIVEGMRKEVARYEQLIYEKTGTRVRLG